MIADSSLFIAHFRGESGATRLIEETPDLVIPFVVAAELFTGALLASNPAREDERVRSLLATFPMLWPDEQTLVPFARVRVEQRRAGTPMGVHDNWIAALAIQYHEAIASEDTDFSRIRDLQVVTWT